MALDLRLYNCLPEHQGPAFRTWSQIIQTTAMSSNNLASPLLSPNSCSNLESSFPSLLPAEDFLPLSQNGDSEKPEDEELDNGSVGKRKRGDRCERSGFSDVSLLTYAPWKRSVYPDNAYGLHLEIKEFYDYMSPSPEEKFMRQSVVKKIQDLILGIWPAARIEIFGSFKTNLYLPTSDIDLVVFGNWEKLPLWTLEKALVNENIADSSTIKVLDKASVPIIKLTEKRSNLKVDISFNMDTAVKGAELIQEFLKDHKVLPYLFLALKHFLVMRDLNEVFTGGISSYCLMLLTVSFLQMHPRQETRLPNANIGVLLIEFFELYGRNFNYQRTGIKLRDGGCYCSKDEIMREMSDGQFPSLLCIEDPVSKVIDIGKSSYGIMRVKEAFEYAYNVLDSALRNRHYFKINPDSTYLSRIIRVSPELIQYRRWVKTHYPLTPSCQSETVAISDPDPNVNEISNKEKADEDSSQNGLSSCDGTLKFDIWSSDASKASTSKDSNLDTNKNKIDEIIQKTSGLRSDIVKASIASSKTVISKGETSKGEAWLTCRTNEGKTFGLSDQVCARSSEGPSSSKSFHNSHKCHEEKVAIQTSEPTTTETDHTQENRVTNLSALKNSIDTKSRKFPSQIGIGGENQWSSDENCPAESSNKTSQLNKKMAAESELEKSDKDSHFWIRNERSPCEGISKHDLANAQHARQLIISSPEKPCAKPEKWFKEDAKHFHKENQIVEKQKFTNHEDRHRDLRKKWLGKDSQENPGDINHAKQQHQRKQNDEHIHHYDDNGHGHKFASGHRRRFRKDAKSQ